MLRRFFTLFSYISIGLVTIFLILMLTRVIPTDWFIYVLGFSILLLVVRLVLRLYFLYESRKLNEKKSEER